MAEGIQIKNLPSTTAIKQGDTMTIVQDKQNKQLSLDVFANESDLATLSPLENRCDEVKAKVEVDEYSAEITTSQSISEIGSDDNGANLHENVLDGAYESCVLKGKTKYIDNDTQEILDTFQEGRNLSLIDVKSPILSNVGKNLFDINKINTNYNNNNSKVTVENNKLTISYKNNGRYYINQLEPLYLKPNTKYTFSITGSSTGDYKRVHLGTARNVDANQYATIRFSEVEETKKTTFITNNTGCLFIHFYPATTSIGTSIFYNMQLEEGSTVTTYEPYKSNILSFNQKDDKTIVLRSLPNGVCDTLNVETGEYVQRVYEVTLTSDNLGTGNNPEGNLTFMGRWYFDRLGIPNTVYNGVGSLNADFPVIPINESIWTGDKEGVTIQDYNDQILDIRISKAKLSQPNIDGLKEWINANPITVQYQLKTPIVSTIDVQGFPHAYKNGHIQLSSGSTEPSLTPTVTYKVPVSRVGQIASNTKSNLRQTIKLDQLEILAYQSLINAEYENLLVQNSAESAASFTNLSTNDPKDELYYMLKHLIEEDQPVQNMLDKINLFYLYGLLSDEHYFDLLLGGEEDVY